MIKDCIFMCDRDRLLSEVCRLEHFPQENKAKVKERYSMLLDSLVQIEPKAGEWIILGMSGCDGDKKVVDAYLFSIDDIISKFEINKTLERLTEKDIENLSEDELSDIINSVPFIESYAYELQDWSKVLGYKVYKPNLEEYGLERVMAAVLYEMTFLGFTEGEVHKQRQKIEAALAESLIDLAKDTKENTSLTSDDLCEEMGFDPSALLDTRTTEEIRQDNIKEYRRILRRIVEKYHIFTELLTAETALRVRHL